MTFSQLHERLRLEMWRRIQRGVVTGKLLAAQTGLRPSHISNFLHRKRNLSLAALDKLLDAQQISIQELAGLLEDVDDLHHILQSETLRVPVIAQGAAFATPIIPRRAVQSYISLPATEFARFRPSPSPGRRSWERFVGMRVTANEASAMEPLLKELSIVVIDRHYNLLAQPAPPVSTLYALRLGNRFLLRYVTFDSNRLLLRPYCLDYPVEVLENLSRESLVDLLLGRVCLHLSEI